MGMMAQGMSQGMAQGMGMQARPGMAPGMGMPAPGLAQGMGLPGTGMAPPGPGMMGMAQRPGAPGMGMGMGMPAPGLPALPSMGSAAPSGPVDTSAPGRAAEGAPNGLTASEVEAKLDTWAAVRRKGDYETADKLRDELRASGVDDDTLQAAKGRGKGKGGNDGLRSNEGPRGPEVEAKLDAWAAAKLQRD